MGSVVLILNMTGHERDTAKGVAIASGLNVTLNAVLVFFFGIVGAAAATSVSVICMNLILARLAYLRTGYIPSALARSSPFALR
jgi:O-antigen/teichoic acid export membrane protein